MKIVVVSITRRLQVQILPPQQTDMISEKIINEAKEFAVSESNLYKSPTPFALQLSLEKGKELAKKLSAQEDIVTLGVLLMDCQLGVAVKEKRIKDHISMSAEKASEFLKLSNLEDGLINAVVGCIREHHGSNKFTSLESEICCNADCYRFISANGFLGAFRYVYPDMNLHDFILLIKEKIEEKWGALSLDICRQELEPQYKAIKTLLENYKD